MKKYFLFLVAILFVIGLFTVDTKFPYAADNASCVDDPNAQGKYYPPEEGLVVRSDGSFSEGTSGTMTPGVKDLIPGGSSASFSITVSASNGFSGSVSMGVDGLPEGVKASFSPASVSVGPASATTVLTLCATPGTPNGVFNFFVHAGNPQIFKGFVNISKVSPNAGSSASPINKITPVEIKKLKLLPDVVQASSAGPKAVVSENLSSGSLDNLGLTNYASGEVPGLVVDVAYMNWWKNGSGGVCKDGDDVCYIGTPVPGNLAGPRYFSLSDPMNPELDTSKIWNINFSSSSGDYTGDPGGYLHATNALFSQDGEYSKVTSNGGAVSSISQGNNSHTHMRGGGLFHKGFIQSGGYTYLVSQDQTDARLYNVTNFNSSVGYIYANQNASQTPYFQPMPSSAPGNFGPGQVALLGADKFAYFSFSLATGSTVTPSIKFYSVTKPSFLAKLNLPTGIKFTPTSGAGGFSTPDGGKYAYIFDSNQKFYLYKLSSDEKSVIKVVEGIFLDSSQFTPSVVGMSVAGNKAIMTFNSLSSSVGGKSTAPHIYLLSDLANNVKKDVYGGPSPIYAPKKVASYITANETYVYSSGNVVGFGLGNRVYVWKFGTSSINASYSGSGSTPPPPPSPTPGAYCPSANGSVGCIRITPLTSKNGQKINIKLFGLDSTPGAPVIPEPSVVKIFSDNGDGVFKDFGNWYTVGQLKAGVDSTLNCSKYASYLPPGDPKGSADGINDVTGKILYQKIYFAYGGTDKKSNITAYTIDCRTSTTPKKSSVPWYIKYLIE